MIKIKKSNILTLHKAIIDLTGGSREMRDYGLMDSALNSAYQTFDGVELYPTNEEKGAKLGFSLINNHAFVDGNKRIGLLVMLTFLEMNGVFLKYNDDDLIKLGLGLADGKISYDELLKWINDHKKAEYEW